MPRGAVNRPWEPSTPWTQPLVYDQGFSRRSTGAKVMINQGFSWCQILKVPNTKEKKNFAPATYYKNSS